MSEELDQTSENKPARDERGRLLPGNTANPNGRPPGSFSLTAMLKELLQEVPEGQKLTYAQAFIKKMLHKAINEGDEQTQKLIMNYIEGLPRQPIDLGVDKESLSELTQFFKILAERKDE